MLKRIYLSLALVAGILSTHRLYADASIFFVKKSLMMENEQIPVHDYYLNAGKKDGLKAGMLVRVARRIPFQDTAMVKINEQLEIELVELKLIHVQDQLSVGRLYRSLLDENSPVLDYQSVMIGDRVQLGSRRWPAPEKKHSTQGAIETPSQIKESTPATEESATMASQEPKASESAKAIAVPKPALPVAPDNRALSIPIGGEFQPRTL